MNYKDYFRDKKITVIGLGLLGRGVGDVEFLAKQGAILTVTDLKTEAELKDSLDKLKKLPTYELINFHLGGHRLEDFQKCDLVLKAAGVPLDSPFIAEARKNNIPVKMSSSLFAKFFSGTIIGVTGTRGKSTVSAMIFEILKTVEKKTFLGGNVRGVSTLAHLSACGDLSAPQARQAGAQAGLLESASDEIAVLELDSWQLQGFGEEKLSPHIAVFTTFYPDHLNYYAGDMDKYLKDKANIFKFQNEDDHLILGEQAVSIIKEKFGDLIKSKITVAKPFDISKYKLKVPGEHNRYNASCAAKVAEALGVLEKDIKKGLESFKGIEGRLELIRGIDGIKIYNDTTSTTPEATIAALRALVDSRNKKQDSRMEPSSLIHESNIMNHESRHIVLIMGGSDKGLDFSQLLEALPRFCKAVILLPGTGTDNLRFKISDLRFKERVIESKTLSEAVEKAMELAEKGDFVLFSPAFTSFGMFKNEFDRGEKFNEIVMDL